jgi:hypothetical protein
MMPGLRRVFGGFAHGLLSGSCPFLDRVRNSREAKLFENPARPEFPLTDIAHCVDIDRFDFAMPVTKENGRSVMRAVIP